MHMSLRKLQTCLSHRSDLAGQIVHGADSNKALQLQEVASRHHAQMSLSSSSQMKIILHSWKQPQHRSEQGHDRVQEKRQLVHRAHFLLFPLLGGNRVMNEHRYTVSN